MKKFTYRSIFILALSILPLQGQIYHNIFQDEFKDETLSKWNIVGNANVINETLSISRDSVVLPRIQTSINPYRVAFNLRFIKQNQRIFIGIRSDHEFHCLGFYINQESGIINAAEILKSRKVIFHSVIYHFDVNQDYLFAIHDTGEFFMLFIDDKPICAFTKDMKPGEFTFIKSYNDGIEIDDYSIKIEKRHKIFNFTLGRPNIIKNPPIHKVSEDTSIFSLLCAGFFALFVAKLGMRI